MDTNNLHWVACWGNATSIADRKECTYARDLTLRYPIRMCFAGEAIRLHFSNLTGTEPVQLTRVVCNHHDVLFAGQPSVSIAPGTEIQSDILPLSVHQGETLTISIYLGEFTQMNAGTLITGPLSSGQYCYGNYIDVDGFPIDLSRKTNWFWFLNTVDILTDRSNYALVCYGDSITAQSWPDYLTLRCEEQDYRHVAVIRRAVSGTRILRQYDCITYAAYGLKGATRFPIETQVAGMRGLIIQHGINDIIHPVGVEVNPFRPWSDMPSLDDLTNGYTQIYLDHMDAINRERAAGGLDPICVYSGTLLPIYGWRTYTHERDVLRKAFNEWMLTHPTIPCIDFDQAVRDEAHPEAFRPGFDSGDHLHPSETAYRAMADAVPEKLLHLTDKE